MVKRHNAFRFSAASLAIATALAVVPAGAAHAADADTPVLIPSAYSAPDAFYDTPKHIPAKPGTLVRSQRIKSPSTLTVGKTQIPFEYTRIMYSSRNTHNKPIAVSGFYAQPQTEWKGPGERPLIVVSPTTRGGDSCAPSKAVGGMLLDLKNPGALINLDGDLQSVVYFLLRGYNVVVTDYEGSGTEGIQPFANRKSQAHVTLDALRAAKQLKNTTNTADQPLFLYGYSQGGGASAAAAEILKSYAPELNIKGAYAGGVPAKLRQVLSALDGSVSSGLISMALAGLAYSYPEFNAWIQTELNDLGKWYIKHGGTACTAGVTVPNVFAQTTRYTKSHKSFMELLAHNPKMIRYLDMQNLGSVVPGTPILVHSSYGDDLLPFGQVADMVADWTKLGAKNVYFHATPLRKVAYGFGVSHLIPDPPGVLLADIFFMHELGGDVPAGVADYVMN